jgi:beta-glucosidase
MRKILIAAAGCLLASGCVAASSPIASARDQLPLATRSIELITVDGLQFRDLDRDGALTPYEDWRLSPQQRATDLLARMTIGEKVGEMVVADIAGDAPYGQPAASYDLAAVSRLLATGITQFNSRLETDVTHLAAGNNAVQELAERSRLGIPALIMSDPRHGNTQLVGATMAGGHFSAWPNNLGFAALADTAATERYAATIRDDFRAVGFTLLLGPQIDLATEPRWPRAYDTFGEDAELSASLSGAFVRGLQGGENGIARGGVAATIKHFAGYAASVNGFDAHNRYGRYSSVDAGEFVQQLKPFEGALKAHPSSVMPTYAVLRGLVLDRKPVEEVGTGYSKPILAGVLRQRLGFNGVVLSDWGITNDCGTICQNGFPAGERPTFQGISMAWGVEDLTQPQRFAKAIDAGMDQFGGVSDPGAILQALKAGLISSSQVDASVRRILERSFELGIFDAPFVDASRAAEVVGAKEKASEGRQVQARSMVVLQQRIPLSLKRGMPVALFGVDKSSARDAGLSPVDDPKKAQIAIVRLHSPSQRLHPNFMFGSMQQEGSLEFDPADPGLKFIRALPASVKVIVDVQLDRPAILTPLAGRADILLGSFGASDRALMDVLMGRERPVGRLPFELPSSMAAVEAQRPGTAADSAHPLFPLGYRFAD